ncbi:hypothetical protein ACFFHM_18380 [Halalkalibacter kiskunsagensis]|uniref:Uncharacterized protein n=1 Tax=Halalkalibacter kiskunsagensis TaxID=1548599 RepID=A0ABV6KGE5_9BACI
MTSTIYQAKAGDGFKKTGLKRTNSFFNTPREAVSEALALKEQMDLTYDNKIEWDYNGKITGSNKKLNFLRGYLGGDKETKPFYLQIVSVESPKKARKGSPIEAKKLTSNDKKVLKKVVQLFK